MKKSSIFLGATAFVLALAGAFATKATKLANVFYYLTVGSGSTYHAIPVQSCTNTSGILCKYTVTGNSYTVFYKTSTTSSTFITAYKN